MIFISFHKGILNKIIIGAIFCQDIIIIKEDQVKEEITGVNQKWKGAAPSFNPIPKISIIIVNLLNLIMWEVIPADKNRIDPVDCVIKYFVEASEVWFCGLNWIIAKKDNIFNSKPAQTNNQCLPIEAIKVPKINVNENNRVNGAIKVGKVLNSLKKVRSLFFFTITTLICSF